MTQLSRWLARVELARAAAGWLGLALLVVLAGFLFAAYYQTPTLGPVAAAVALLAVGSSGLLYAWRLGAGGPGD